jgi:hypothetical protein
VCLGARREKAGSDGVWGSVASGPRSGGVGPTTLGAAALANNLEAVVVVVQIEKEKC